MNSPKFQTISQIVQSIPDEFKYGFLGSLSSLTFMTILDFITTLVMAFLVGVMGSIGGILTKKLYDKFSKKKK